MGDKVRVGLVYGGRSGEHEVSLQTALAVMKAFDYTKYEIKPFYITKEGDWRAGDAPARTAGWAGAFETLGRQCRFWNGSAYACI